ncbi:MAG TPA: DUF452 family protein [bacterium]|mgnify:CR=1 FL=1|nr:DUF452 family protein [bacterium]
MKNTILIDKGNKNLIVFFSGWSIEPDDLSFLESENYDVSMIHSYDSFYIPPFRSAKYENIIGVAYSLGVFSVSIAMKYQRLPINEIYAINGTGKPVDNKYGIREKVFEKTCKNLNSKNLAAFQRNMFDSDVSYNRFLQDRTSFKTIENLKEELEFFLDQSTLHDADCSIFKKVLISDKDRIFPSVNQTRFWKDANRETIEGGHFPFYNFASWDEIIELCRK